MNQPRIDYESFIEKYIKALLLKPDWPEGHLKLGEIYRESGQYENAITSFKEAIHLNPDWAEAHLELGKVYLEKGKLGEAFASLKEACRLKPESIRVYLRSDPSFSLLKDSIGQDSESAEAHYLLGLAYKSKGEKALAEDYLYRAANFFLTQGNREGALEAYDQIRSLESPLADRIFKKLYPPD